MSLNVSFTGAGSILLSGRRLVLEVRKKHRWEYAPGQPPRIGLGSIGGSLEPGETPLQALHREALEEIGCPIEVWSAQRTAYVTPEEVRILSDFDLDGVRPAMVWEVTDPTFVVGSHVAVFLARVEDDPQPRDLPGIVLAEPELIPRIGFDSISIAEVKALGAEVRANTELPAEGRLILANTLHRFMVVYQSDPGLFDELMSLNSENP